MGYLRFAFIIAVAFFHLTNRGYAAGFGVFGLYTFLGYLITMICCEVYRPGLRGRMYFLANRAVRVLPGYYVCFAISFLCIAATGFTAERFNPHLTPPGTFVEWLVAFTIVGQSGFEHFPTLLHVIPVTWSLSTEIVYYFIIGFITGRSRRLTAVAFALALVMAAVLIASGAGFAQMYFTVYGPAPVFLLGAMFYHYGDALKSYCLRRAAPCIVLALIALFAADVLTAYFPEYVDLSSAPAHLGAMYAASVIFGYAILCLHRQSRTRPTGRLEQFCADVSYPMFLLHWPVGAMVSLLLFGEPRYGVGIFFLSLAVTFCIASLEVFLVEHPVKALRLHLRKKGAGK